MTGQNLSAQKLRSMALGLGLLILTWPLFALEIPRLTGPVVDLTGTLSPGVQEQLSNKIRALKKAGPQFQVAIIPDLEGLDIESYSIKLAEEWQIGNAQKDDGAIFLLALKERKMRIEVGQGLEGQLTDVACARILSQTKDYFRQGDFAGGVDFTLAAMASSLGYDWSLSQRPQRKGASSNKKRMLLHFFLLLFIPFYLFSSVFLRGRGRYYSGRGPWSGGGFGGGGGGSWGGGGGGFSGGGSSSSW